MRIDEVWRNCSVAFAIILLSVLLLAQSAWAGYTQYTCKNGQSVRSADACKNRGGVVSQRYIALCGDGVLDVGEQCDEGSNNSDSRRNACRTDCRRAYCGDGTIDSGEQCDDGSYNSDSAANQCRRNCRLPVCGDGVVDDDRHRGTNTAFNEMCDDGNKTNSDGCMDNCRTCLQLNETGNIDIISDTALCPAQYLMDDYGDYGAIIIKATGVTLDCQGAILVGEGRGVGILNFRSNDVTIKDCTVRGYDVGLRLQDARNVNLVGNQICDNRQRDVDLVDTDAADVQGYTPPMAPTAKCATAEIQQRARNLAKIAVAVPADTGKGAVPERPELGAKKARPKKPKKIHLSSGTKSVKPMNKVAVQPKPSVSKSNTRFLVRQAKQARWSNGAGKVVFGSDRLPQQGLVRVIPRGHLANGQQVANMLLTQPAFKEGGYIQGAFPVVQLGSKPRFKAMVALLKVSDPADTLQCEVMVREGKEVRVAKSRRIRGTHQVVLEADLSRWSGKKVELILKARHLKGQRPLPAVWINPTVVVR